MKANQQKANGTPDRPRNPQGEGSRLRDELIAAAGRLLAGGTEPDGLSLRAVAREAGVSAPSVYLQFENKDALVHAVVVEHFAAFQRAIESSLVTGNDPVSRLLNGCLAYGHFAAAWPGSYRIIFESRLPIWPGLAVEELPGMDALQVLVHAVAACIDGGQAKPGDPFQIAVDIWAALHGMVTLRQQLDAFPWPDADAQVTRVVAALAGIEDIRAAIDGGVAS